MQDIHPNRSRINVPSFPTIPCLLALILISVYTQGFFPRLTLEAVHLACIFLISLVLIPGISEKVNAKKSQTFASAVIISTADLGLELEWKLPQSPAQLSLWAVVWTVLLLLSLACLITVLIRLLRWTQSDWEEIQQVTQEQRREDKANRQERRRIGRENRQNRRSAATDARRQRWSLCRQYWEMRLNAWKQYLKEKADIRHIRSRERVEHEEELKVLRHQYEVQEEDARRAHMVRLAQEQRAYEEQREKERREHEKQRYEERRAHEEQREREQLEHEKQCDKLRQTYADWLKMEQGKIESHLRGMFAVDPQSHFENIKSALPTNWPKGKGRRPPVGLIVALITAILLVILFVVPCFGFVNGWVSNWANAVISITKPIAAVESDAIQAIILYLTVIMLIAIIASVGITVLYRFVQKKLNDSDDGDDSEDSSFLENYAPAITLLAVGISFMNFLGDGGTDTTLPGKICVIALNAILFILVGVTAFEVARLMLEECGRAGSLLKCLLHMVFVAILDFLTQIIFGVLKGLQIENTISSLLSLVISGNDDTSTHILKKLKGMFHKEIDNIGKPKKKRKKKHSTLKKFHSHRIWKKGDYNE